MKSETLKKLEEITPCLDDITYNDGDKDFIEYNVGDSGTAIGFGVWKQPEIAVQRVFMSKGTIFPKHNHPEHEYVLVYKGSFKVHRCEKSPARMSGKHSTDKTGILGVGDGIYFAPNEEHWGEILEDTWILSTTIPAGEGYPDA